MTLYTLDDILEGLDLDLLPVGAYVVDPNGLVVGANRLALELLGPDLIGTDILRLYVDPSERENFHRQRRELETKGRPIQKLRCHFKVGNKRLEIEDHTRAVRAPDGTELGMVCCIVDRTPESRSADLFERFPGGVYELDGEDHLVNANDRLAKLYGFASANDLVAANLAAEKIFKEPDVAKQLRQEIEDKGEVANFRAEFKRIDGSTFFASITATALFDKHGNYAGREGTVIDISEEERYARLIADMPIGLYQLRLQNGLEVIDHCNDYFALLAGYSRATELKDLPMEPFHESRESYQALVSDLEERGEILDRIVNVRKHDNATPMTAQVSTRLVGPSIEGAIRRVGAARDVTAEIEQKELIEVLTRDIGNTLHAYSATLLQIRHSLDPVLELFGADPEKLQSADTESALGALLVVGEQLRKSLLNLLLLKEQEHSSRAFDAAHWASLGLRATILEAGHLERAKAPIEVRHAAMRDTALHVLSTLTQQRPGHVPRELIREVQGFARDLAQRASVVTLQLARDAVIEMASQVRGLREFVTSRQPGKPEISSRFNLAEILGSAIRVHAEYAHARGVDLRISLPDRPLFVKGRERALVRALENLIHNGIKYSWFRQGAYVQLTLETLANGRATISVRNLGVPIARDEYPKVFEIGYRGRYSGDRRRTGTGIGLHDARRVAQEHHGELTVVSRPVPASMPHRSEFSDVPHLTTFTLTLPTIP